jgi:hypothetical protein
VSGGQTIGPPQDDMSATGQPDELEEVRYHWGEAYDVTAGSGEFTAQRRDGKGAKLTDPAAGGLLRQIRADYQADPVPRDLP